MSKQPTNAVVIPFGVPSETRGLHVARRLGEELRRAGLASSPAAAGLRDALRRRLGNPPLWDAVVAGAEVLTAWAYNQPTHVAIDPAEDAINRASAWLHATMPRVPEVSPFDDDVLGVLLDGEWTTYSLASGERLEPHPTAPKWIYELPSVE